MQALHVPDPDDRELVRRISQGDADALACLYDRHAGRVFGLLLRLLGRQADAEDVLQETFAQVWTGAARYDPLRATPLVWILMIARSRALDHLRSRGPRTALELAEIETTTDVHLLLEQSERAVRVAEALRRLPDAQRETLVLSFFRGLTHPEIARHQGVSLGTAKSRIRLGLVKLRELLEESEEVPSR